MHPLEKKFFPETCHIILAVGRPNIPERIRQEAKRLGLVEKPEHHISVAVTKNSKKIRAALNESGSREELQNKVQGLLDGLAWEYSLLDEYFLMENLYDRREMEDSGYPSGLMEHSRRTIIQKVEMADMSLFYRDLSALLEVPFDVPVPHITIFSWSDHPDFTSRGIGISSQEDFDTYQKKALDQE